MKNQTSINHQTPHFGKQMLAEVPLKCCSKCKEEKLLTDFYKNKIEKDGLRYECKGCFPKPNKSKKAVNDKKYALKNKDKIKIKMKRFYEQNKEEHNQKSKLWKINNPLKAKLVLKKSWMKSISLVDNTYAKRILSLRGFSKDTINKQPELIETIKIIIKTKRLCKTSQN